jgi:hypothetical protein
MPDDSENVNAHLGCVGRERAAETREREEGDRRR